MENMNYELKYCERCGTLKLRPVASETTYCRACQHLLGRYAFPREAGPNNSQRISLPPGLKIAAGVLPPVSNNNLTRGVQ